MEKFENDGTWESVSSFGLNSTIYARGAERVIVNSEGYITFKYKTPLSQEKED